MKFFVPKTKLAESQSIYNGIAKSVQDQLRLTITERKIFSIEYIHDKKKLRAEVGKLDPQRGRYEVLAIFASKPYIVFTRAANGSQGLTILVNGDEITDIVDFD